MEAALRLIRESDLDEVMAVERAAYAHPWSKRIFQDCLAAGYECWLMETEEEILGHGVMSVGGGECQILNICVHPRHRRQGLARSLLRHLLSRARVAGAGSAFLEVRFSNGAAQALYRSEGFVEVGRRPGYYPAGRSREDGLILAKELLDP